MAIDPTHAHSDRTLPLGSSVPFPFQDQTVEAQLAAVLDQIGEAFFALDYAGCCLYLNHRAKQLLGCDSSNLLHQSLWSIFQVDRSSQLYQRCHQALAQQKLVVFEEFYAAFNQWFAVRLVPMSGGVAAYFQDITERQQIKAQLQKEQEFLKVLLDSIQVGIVACDAEGRLTLFNRAARSFHGLAEQPLPPEQWANQYNLYRPDGQTPMRTEEIPLYRAWQGALVQNLEMMIVPEQGTARLLLVSGQAICRADGTKAGAVVVMHDITEQRQVEQALQEREAQLSSIFQTIPDGIIILDQTGHIVSANPAAEVILRLTRSSITDRAYNDPAWVITTVEGSPFPEVELPFAQVMQTKQSVYGVEHAITGTDGAKIFLSINASPLLDADGQITHVIAAISDITERHQAEADLRDSEERYRSVIETAAEGIVLQTADGSILTCNASAERILGLTAAQMTGRTSLDSRWQAIQEDGSPFLGENHPAMVTLRTGEPQSDVIMGIHKPEGVLTWISINTRPLLSADSLMPYAVVSSFFDITDRRNAEEALRQTEQRYRSVVNNVKDVIFQTDAAGNWTFLNPAWTEITGFSIEESLGTSFFEYVHPDDRQRNVDYFRPLIRREKDDCRHDIRYLTKAGDFRWIEVFARLTLAADDTVLGTAGTLSDITERKKANEERVRLVQEQTARTLAEAAQVQSAFLAEASEILASSLDYEETLQSVAQLAVPYFADWCSVDLLREDGSIDRVAVAHIEPTKVQLGWELAQRFPRHLDDSYGIAQVMKTGKSEIAREITEEQLKAAIPKADYLEIILGLGLKSCIIAPLQARGRVLGSISFIYAETTRQYAMGDLELAEDLARRAALAIDNAYLYHTAQQAQRVAELEANRKGRLQMVSAALSETLTPAQVAEVIVEQSMTALEADGAFMALLDKTGTQLEVVKVVGYKAKPEDIQAPIPLNASVPLTEAVRTGQPVWSEPLAARIERYPHLAEAYRNLSFEAWISLPLMAEGKVMGGLSLSFQQFKPLSQNDQEFMLALTRQCSQAIYRAQLYEAERSARAEAERANRVKDEFLAVLSHELRSPLNPILGWTKILRSQSLPPDKTDRALAIIERNAKLQTQLVEDLLDISKMLRGKLSMTVTPVDLAIVIQGAIETVQLAASAKSIEIQTILQPLGKIVLGDANRLQQVVWNLLSNAIKFTAAQGQVEVTLALTTDDSASETSGVSWLQQRTSFIDHEASHRPAVLSQPNAPEPRQTGHYAEITVTDTGKGISAEFLPYLFDYFRQADSSITRQFGGLGLGLAIARQIVELHGGTICADSPGEGLGATFVVRLPIARIEAERPTVQDSPVQASHLKGLRILVVDDEADMRDLAEFVLSDQGAQVTLAASAAEAIAMLSQFIPDVLLCDIGMPTVDGYALMKQIRERSPELGGSIPAIALTAYAGEYNRQQAIAAGFQEHLAKPVEPEALVKAIFQVINQR